MTKRRKGRKETLEHTRREIKEMKKSRKEISKHRAVGKWKDVKELTEGKWKKRKKQRY